MRDLVTPSTQTHTHTNECYTHTHTKEVEEMRRVRRIPSEGSSQAHPQRQPRREDQKMKVGGDVVSSSDEGCIRRLAAAQQTTTTSHARGLIYIRLTSRRDRETPHTRLRINGGLGAHRAALFFFTARENAFDSRDTFKDADGPSEGFVGDTHTHAHTCTGRRGRASSTARSFNFRQAKTTRLFRRSLTVIV